MKVPFRWHDAPGIPAPADLTVEVAGQTVLQVSSVGSRPFARAGLDVTLLNADTDYSLVFTRTEKAITMRIERADGAVAYRTAVPAASSAELVMPESYMRPAVTMGVAK